MVQLKIHTFRLRENSKLRESLDSFVKKNHLHAGLIITVVGALKSAKLRMAEATKEKQDIRDFKGDFEIVSLTGTLSPNGSHLHISLGDKEGRVIGGHLKEGIVSVTAEVSILELNDVTFSRELDPETGFEELVVRKN